MGMIEDTLERIAEKILALDEASLVALLDKYRHRMEQFDVSREWERSVIIFFIINAVRAKNQIFNEQILKSVEKKELSRKKSDIKGKPALRLIKREND
ncbi:MAG: hypothetical protein N2317_06900 [Syntrophales bacterium]|nr:hypothetical protein [Syntrophales bacterium]